MRSVDSIGELRAVSRAVRAKEQKIALVTTMGALHEGHLSLVRRAKQLADVVVMSIFVNPTQFRPGEDFERYPRDLLRDAALAAEAGVDILFTPSVREIYPEGFSTSVNVDRISERFEGAARPGHFRGVATVVLKLFQIVGPDVAVFGQKDAQQTVVVKTMVRDLDLGVEVVVAPTVRESDGLAMSSRNGFLSPEEREGARILSRALRRAEAMSQEGETDAVRISSALREEIATEARARLDYAELVSPESFEPVAVVAPGSIAVVAASFGSTRLIDNVVLNPHSGAVK